MTGMNESQMQKAMFLQLILQFQTAAMIGMGKIKNPVTDKIERDMEQARYAIDMLDMIKTRTKGNIDSDEEKFLEQILKDLKLNFVDEKNKDSVKETKMNKSEVEN